MTALAPATPPSPPLSSDRTATQPNGHSLPHAGQKRRASDEFDNQSVISSSFKKLRINHAPLPSRPVGVSFRSSSPIDHAVVSNLPASPSKVQNHLQRPSSIISTASPNDEGYMPIDDTPHRIVIHDLASEIAEIESLEQAHQQQSQYHFPSDVDKKVSGIPQRLLQGQYHDLQRQQQQHQPHASGSDMALVLYTDPTSISVPEEEDAVRKAIVESRRRVRERQRVEREDGREQEDRVRKLANTSPTSSITPLRPYRQPYQFESCDRDGDIEIDLDPDPNPHPDLDQHPARGGDDVQQLPNPDPSHGRRKPSKYHQQHPELLLHHHPYLQLPHPPQPQIHAQEKQDNDYDDVDDDYDYDAMEIE